jgi:hypothetical protein
VRNSPEITMLRRLLPMGEVASLREISDRIEVRVSELPIVIRSLEEIGFVFRKTAREISLVQEPHFLVSEAILARLHTTTIG